MLRGVDADGWPRTDAWTPGAIAPLPEDEAIAAVSKPAIAASNLSRLLDRAASGRALTERDIVSLFRSRGDAFSAVTAAADDLRASVCGDAVSYVVTRNINYTNICSYRCQFCAFSKGKTSENLRGRPYELSDSDIGARVREAWSRGATEVCMQGGIHPSYTGQTYLDICQTVKQAAPRMHVHAFSPLEVHHGAQTLGVPVSEFLAESAPRRSRLVAGDRGRNPR